MRWMIVVACLLAGPLLSSAAQAQDLTISSFTTSVSGTVVTYTAKVCNTGSSTSTTFFLDIYYDRPTAPSCGMLGEAYHTFQGLAAGACATHSFTQSKAPNGSHTAWAQVDSLCDVDETNELNNIATSTYTVSSLADLIVSSFTTSVSGTTATLSVTVCNVGATAAGTFDLETYFHPVSAPPGGCPAYGDEYFEITGGLAPGACTSRSFVRTGLAPGTYTDWTRADSGCDVPEASEANNNASTTYTIGATLPDLTTTLGTTVSGGTVTFNVKVCNNGATAASNFDVDIYYDSPTAPGGCPAYGDDYAQIASLAAGACTTKTFTRTGAPTGTHLGWVRADTECVVTESNEGNNNGSSSYTVGALPDLRITAFTTAVNGTTVSYNVTVCNSGVATGATFYLDLYYDRATGPVCPELGNLWDTINGLGASACTTRTFTRTGTPYGSYRAWARVDSTCDVDESNEGNNNASSIYAVSNSADLTVQSLTTSVNGGDVTFTATVCNTGGMPASNIDLELYYHLTGAPGCATTHDQQLTIASLAPAACTTRVFTRTGSPSGSFTGWVRVDADCSITEGSETNNNKSSAYSVQPDLTVQTLATSVSGSTVSFDVTVCNKGGGTTATFDVDVYYNRVGAPACPALGEAHSTIPGMPSGVCLTQTFTRQNTPAGSYTAWARVDSHCTVTESSETNNNASSPYTVATQTDLVVQSFTAAVSGTTVTFNVNVCNNGGSAATSFDLELYYNLAVAPGCASAADDETIIASLAPGACATKSFTRTAAPAGAFTAWARVDADCAVTESDEANNNAQTSYTVGAQPDLVVQSLTATVNGTTVTFTANVCNNGGPTAASFYLDLYYNRATGPDCPTLGDAYLNISGGLASGACVTKTFVRTGTPVGAFTGWARADSACAVAESNETNNNTQAAYTVLPAIVDAGVKDQGSSKDQSPRLEAGSKKDTGQAKLDLGSKVDLAVKKDTSLMKIDQGLSPDSGPPIVRVDGAAGVEAGQVDLGEEPPPTTGNGGCGCAAGPQAPLADGWLLLALLGLALIARRRR